MNNKHDNRVVIVNSSFGNLIDISIDEVFHEFRELVLSSDAEILFEFNFNQKVVNAKHFIGKGKLEEIKRIIDLNKIELIIFNNKIKLDKSINIMIYFFLLNSLKTTEIQ